MVLASDVEPQDAVVVYLSFGERTVRNTKKRITDIGMG